jgi:nucleotide-binding universal stress UspA family protein
VTTVAETLRGVELMEPSSAPIPVHALLVPLDGSAFSRAALAVAVPLAGRLRAGIHVLGVVGHDEDVRRCETQLAAVDVPAASVTRSVVVSDDPAGAIMSAVGRLPGAVVCMGTHGRDRSRGQVGAVAREVVARSPDPLVLACSLVDPLPGGQGVLACVDGGPSSATIVAVAAEWADRLGDVATVVTVAARPDGQMGRADGNVLTPAEAEAALDALARRALNRGHRLRTLVLRDPVGPSCGLHRHLCDHPARLVIAGTRSHTGLPRLVLGIVAGDLVRHSPSPVLVVPGGGRGTPPAMSATGGAGY